MKKVNNYALMEGLIFIAGEEGISNQKIAKKLNLSLNLVNEMLITIQQQLAADESRGIALMNNNNVFKFMTKQEHFNIYESLVIEQTSKLSTAALETLAIIAYKGPIVKSEIESIRGVSSDFMVAKLKARELIVELGRSDAPGRPILYGVSQYFLDYFNLSSLDKLPPLPESFFDKDEDTNLFIN